MWKLSIQHFPKPRYSAVLSISSSGRYVSYKDIKQFTADLKPVYKAPTEEIALAALDEFEAKWSKKYPLGVKSWRVNWNELATMFKYPPEIRKLIYTTNAIENFNRQLRKGTKPKSAFVSDAALMKILYLTTMQIVDKWTMPIRDWGMILDNLMIYFGDRVKFVVFLMFGLYTNLYALPAVPVCSMMFPYASYAYSRAYFQPCKWE